MNDMLKIHFNAEHRLAICRPAGSLGAEHVGQLLNFLLSLEDSNSTFNRLLDLTQVTDIRISAAVIYEYAWARRDTTARLPPFRTAIIAPDPAAEDVAVIYATLMKGSQIRVGVFPDAKSVPEWLGVPEEVLQVDLRPISDRH
jgi:hypothetical protein